MKAIDADELQNAPSGDTTEGTMERETLTQNQARSSPELPQAKLDPRGAPEAQPCPRGSYPRAVPSPPTMVLISIEKEDTSLEP